MARAQPVTCLVTGAFLAAGYRVRCMAREAGQLAGFPAQVEVAEADALDPASLRPELAGVDARLRVPTAVLRAGVIIGSGSASFEMLHYLTERLPVMITPKWGAVTTQPIAIQDVLGTLTGCARLPPEVNRAFDIGGAGRAHLRGDDAKVRCRWAFSARRCPAIGSGWLVLLVARVGRARLPGPGGWRGRTAVRPTRSGPSAARRRARLLAVEAIERATCCGCAPR